MKKYSRKYPEVALCGLNCGLCPRYHTEGNSRCPGCGGENFYDKHPSCKVINCAEKHGGVEFCFDCAEYPCERYKQLGDRDSFITYQNVIRDIEKAKNNTEEYVAQQREKLEILCTLLAQYNDGRHKNFYCLAVNLLELADLKIIMATLSAQNCNSADTVKLFEEIAAARGIVLALRK